MRTSKEAALAHQTSEIFAKAAEQSGKVISVQPEGIIVQYADGTQAGYALGRQFGQSPSLSFPFDIITNLKAGDSFEAGAILCYNEQFFAPDTLAANTVVWKNATYAMVGLVEVATTYEDASSITEDFALKLASKVTEPVSVILQLDQAVHDVVKVGQQVRADDHLCLIENATTAGSGMFSDHDIQALRLMGAKAPRVGVDGVVDRIEILYKGELDDMSESVRELVRASDAQLARSRKAIGERPATGNIEGESYRVDSEPLQEDQLVIFFYITQDKAMGGGDKAVVGNQLKTIVSEVIERPMVTESGVVIDMKFGIKAAGARIVNSVYEMGIDARLCMRASERALAAYNSPVKR